MRTILSLKTGRLRTGVSLVKYRWDNLGRLLNRPPGMLEVAITALLTAQGREVRIIKGGSIADSTQSKHAEDILIQWAIQKYGAKPTPYRLLDVVTTIEACVGCQTSIPSFMQRSRSLLLFEATIFVNWPAHIPQPSMTGAP